MTDLATLAAKDRITDCIHQLFISTDQRDWPKVRACFAKSVHFDMTSLTGGAVADLSPKQITDAWDEGLKPLEHVHHQIGNLQISIGDDEATAFCYGIALHYRTTGSGDNVRRFVGSYDFRLKPAPHGWVIHAFRFNAKFVDGNRDLENSA
ncbi:MAG TPA: nuclear transport factor 2 family protein [Gemmatimonadota bacterium]|nr:nuclear transport factor 2 family protein [Gemmatimonadota bacterium]